MGTEIIFTTYEQLTQRFDNLFKVESIQKKERLNNLFKDLSTFVTQLHQVILSKNIQEPLRNEMVYILLNIVEMRARVHSYIQTYPDMKPYSESVQDYIHRTKDTDLEFYILEYYQREYERLSKGDSINELDEKEYEGLQDWIYQARNILKKHKKNNNMSSFLKEGYRYMIDFFTDKLDDEKSKPPRSPFPSYPLLPILNVSDDEEQEDGTIVAVMDDEKGNTVVRTFSSTIPDIEY